MCAIATFPNPRNTSPTIGRDEIMKTSTSSLMLSAEDLAGWRRRLSVRDVTQHAARENCVAMALGCSLSESGRLPSLVS
jgi:hypothetical protein